MYIYLTNALAASSVVCVCERLCVPECMCVGMYVSVCVSFYVYTSMRMRVLDFLQAYAF